jgi:hypothetical protein
MSQELITWVRKLPDRGIAVCAPSLAWGIQPSLMALADEGRHFGAWNDVEGWRACMVQSAEHVELC